MENNLLHENAGFDPSHRTAVVGLGNPLYGDDAVGLVVAQSLAALLRREITADFLDCSVPDARLGEHLLGYGRAIIVDALVDRRARIGTVRQVEISGPSGDPTLSLHTACYRSILALARMVGVPVPQQIHIYGIAIRRPEVLRVGLSAELSHRIPRVVHAIAAWELRDQRSIRPAVPHAWATAEPPERVKGPP